jgi:hypothetical protein
MRFLRTTGAWRFIVLSGTGALLSSGCGMPDAPQGPEGHLQRPPESPIAAVVPTAGLVGEWKLDGNANDTQNNYDATVFGGATFVAGHLGNALRLNNGPAGTGSKYAEMPSNTDLNNIQVNSYTVSAWFYPYRVPPDNSIDNRYWAIVVKAGQHMGLVYNNLGKFSMRHYLSNGSLEIAQASTIYPDSAWYHVVGTVNRTTGKVKVYVNGAVKDSIAFIANTAGRAYGSTRFRIGKASTNWAADGIVDQVRIYNRALSAAEAADLFSETSSSVPTLPVGVFSYSGIGNGPGNDASGQKWRVLHYAPAPNTIVSQIQQADQDSVLLVLMMPANRNQWETGGVYDSVKYRTQLNRFSVAGGRTATDTAIIADAMARRRIVCYIVDEPNLPNNDLPNSPVWDISPADVAHMAVEHKKRWPNCLTFARVTPTLLNNGWGQPNLPKPQTGYPKLDYAWSQYNHALALAETTPTSAWQTERSVAQGLNVGLAVSLNVWSGGLVKTIPEIPLPARNTCWDWRNTGGALGYILGSNHPAVLQAEGRDCAQNPLVQPYPNVVASPAWIQFFAQEVANDGGFPFLLLWNHATNTVSDSFHNYYVRNDFVSAFDNAILTGRNAEAATWRTPK